MVIVPTHILNYYPFRYKHSVTGQINHFYETNYSLWKDSIPMPSIDTSVMQTGTGTINLNYTNLMGSGTLIITVNYQKRKSHKDFRGGIPIDGTNIVRETGIQEFQGPIYQWNMFKNFHNADFREGYTLPDKGRWNWLPTD